MYSSYSDTAALFTNNFTAWKLTIKVDCEGEYTKLNPCNRLWFLKHGRLFTGSLFLGYGYLFWVRISTSAWS